VPSEPLRIAVVGLGRNDDFRTDGLNVLAGPVTGPRCPMTKAEGVVRG
jgi:hypothetical protein